MKLKEGVGLHLIKTAKFKDMGVSIRFISELKEEWATQKSLLALMLCDRCMKYDTKQKMNEIMDHLYGATLNAQTMGYGAAQVLEIRSKIINPSYLEDDENLLDEQFAFLHEVLFRPRLDEEVLKEAKEVLEAKMQRMQDEPSSYVVNRCLELAGQGVPLGISALGTKAMLKKITLEDIKEAYRQMMDENQIEIIVCGDVDEEQLQHAATSYLTFHDRSADIKTAYTVKMNNEFEMKEEYRDISQTNVMMLWYSDIGIDDEDYWDLKIANAILGQYPTSFLFQEVREKHSLCYSIFSNLISYDGALGVTTGIEKENKDKTIKLIEEQMNRLKQGDFDEALLETSKHMLINTLRSSKDGMNSNFALCFQNTLLHQQRTVEDLIDRVSKVTHEAVVKAANKCKHRYTYILTKEDQDETGEE